MGRTFEVLGGRSRRVADGEPVAIPFPTSEPEPPIGPSLVPIAADDLPSDNDGLPHIEVGGPRPKAPAGPQLREPRASPVPVGPQVAFQLLHEPDRPPVAPPRDLIAYLRPDHPSARQYRLLADGISAQHPAGRPLVLLFTPASSRAASAATLANLAVTRAGDGFGRVLVIEADRAPGSAGEWFGIAPAPGLREVLTRTIPLSLALHRTGVEGVFVVPAGKTHVGIDEAGRLPALLDQFRGRFDWVLVDAPAWGTHPLNDWANSSDGVYLVMRPEEWDAPQADMAHEGIARAGGKLRGCITTQDPVTVPPPVSESANGDGRGNQMVDHVGAPIGVARRRLRTPAVVRRPGDD
jgi:Mrp family chromosome partitioning ATPase